MIRPRSLGACRSRPPLPVLLYLADQEGRLVGRSADAFAVIEPPIARNAEWIKSTRALPGRVRMLGRLVRAWPFLVPYVPFIVAAVVAVPLALVSRGAALVAAALVLAGFAVAVADLIVAVCRLAWSLARAAPADDDIVGHELRGYHWTITYCHATDPARADGLCAEAFEHAERRLSTDPAFGSGLVGVPARSVTDAAVRNALGGLPSLSPLAGTDWFVIGAKGKFRPPDRDAVRPMSVIRLMLAATVLCIAVLALVVASVERQGCPATDCGNRPVTYQQALPWLLRHVIGQFPGPATWPSQVLGALVMVLVPVMALSIVVTLAQRQKYQHARRRLRYESVERMAAEPTVAILVVNEIEHDAVVEAFVARSPGLLPVVERVGENAIHRLGPRIVLARSEQGTVGTGSMPWTAHNLIDRLDPAILILTGVCYGLQSQEIGDLVVCTQLRTMDHRKVTTRPDGSPQEIIRGPRPEPASGLLSHARALAARRPGPAVHFGPVLSLNTLVNNAAERDRLRALDEEAIAGEMELAGLYAAAARAKCDWILVKGISDWGVGKRDDHQAAAARNAADFVADLIAQIKS